MCQESQEPQECPLCSTSFFNKKCRECGYEKIYYQKDQTKENRLEWITGLNLSGYAGILSNGNIVDRREFPEAIPIQANTLFNVAKPKDLNKE